MEHVRTASAVHCYSEWTLLSCCQPTTSVYLGQPEGWPAEAWSTRLSRQAPCWIARPSEPWWGPQSPWGPRGRGAEGWPGPKTRGLLWWSIPFKTFLLLTIMLLLKQYYFWLSFFNLRSGETDRSFNYWFISQMPGTVRAGPGWSQEPCRWPQGSRRCCFPESALAGSWNWTLEQEIEQWN